MMILLAIIITFSIPTSITFYTSSPIHHLLLLLLLLLLLGHGGVILEHIAHGAAEDTLSTASLRSRLLPSEGFGPLALAKRSSFASAPPYPIAPSFGQGRGVAVCAAS